MLNLRENHAVWHHVPHGSVPISVGDVIIMKDALTKRVLWEYYSLDTCGTTNQLT